jgi:hypothetical protein
MATLCDSYRTCGFGILAKSAAPPIVLPANDKSEVLSAVAVIADALKSVLPSLEEPQAAYSATTVTGRANTPRSAYGVASSPHPYQYSPVAGTPAEAGGFGSPGFVMAQKPQQTARVKPLPPSRGQIRPLPSSQPRVVLIFTDDPSVTLADVQAVASLPAVDSVHVDTTSLLSDFAFGFPNPDSYVTLARALFQTSHRVVEGSVLTIDKPPFVTPKSQHRLPLSVLGPDFPAALSERVDGCVNVVQVRVTRSDSTRKMVVTAVTSNHAVAYRREIEASSDLGSCVKIVLEAMLNDAALQDKLYTFVMLCGVAMGSDEPDLSETARVAVTAVSKSGRSVLSCCVCHVVKAPDFDRPSDSVTVSSIVCEPVDADSSLALSQFAWRGFKISVTLAGTVLTPAGESVLSRDDLSQALMWCVDSVMRLDTCP